MTTDTLQPRRQLLCEEYVLVQAWKKTATYIRYHNWFSDTLALDQAAVNLPRFLADLRERLSSPGSWQTTPLRIVPAPKTQPWSVRAGDWQPTPDQGATAARLRPLAHVSLHDQVVATALMLCLADRVETLQGDPRRPLADARSRKRIVSYGNRLFCDGISGGRLRHRWGSVKLYRAYFQDYRAFLKRPQLVVQAHFQTHKNRRVVVVHADLRQFYDRVRPTSLAASVDRLRRHGDDTDFFAFLKSVLDWRWHSHDASEVHAYAAATQLDDFTRVVLPQGLVASGFFANVVLLSFDKALRQAIGTDIAPGLQLADACRYVDDLRITVVLSSQASANNIGPAVHAWLHGLLQRTAPGLQLSDAKLKVVSFGSDQRPIVQHSTRMTRLQTAVSGGFDAAAGEEILAALQGLMRAQEHLRTPDEAGWSMAPIADVGDATLARFAAARFRRTFRSIRPLLQDNTDAEDPDVPRGTTAATALVPRARTRAELDDDARTYALSLIHAWVQDPSNVRLLRIGLDLWPDVEVLRHVIGLLRPFTETGGAEAARRVGWFCFAELLRAGATETGFVPDGELLPAAVNLDAYRRVLGEEATRLAHLPRRAIPWYLRQQALLFLAAFDPMAAPTTQVSTTTETRHYRDVIRFLRGDGAHLQDFPTFAVLARRAFVDRDRAIRLTQAAINPSRCRHIIDKDPAFALELIDADQRLLDNLSAGTRAAVCGAAQSRRRSGELEVLADVVRDEHPTSPLRNELSLLQFTRAFLREWQEQESPPEVITPTQVQLKRQYDAGISRIDVVRILRGRGHPFGALYRVPAWCEESHRWRFQVGFLLRFILSGQSDFTRPVRPAHWKEREAAYRPVGSHWYQRLYGLVSAQPVFGDNWLPITDWMEGFLLALLRWPGCARPGAAFRWIEGGPGEALGRIVKRIEVLECSRGRATRTLLLRLVAKRPPRTRTKRSLRACVIQTAVPDSGDFGTDLTVSERAFRRKHRNHLSAALAAVERMLVLRNTHTREEHRGLDWLILPELSVHPHDVWTHLVPFARAHKTVILAGLTYDEIAVGQPLVNSALWIIPEWSRTYGLRVRIVRQGKAHLAPEERELDGGAGRIQGFRPCQWVVGYPWAREKGGQPLWMTASVCYDATDLELVGDLRAESDVLAIPALNKDVATFDQMALALHYHMFQLVVVANNGNYGGSNAYWPRRGGAHVRQVFHMHGQPQASIAFFDIEDIGAFLKRRGGSGREWKNPPAGLEV